MDPNHYCRKIVESGIISVDNRKAQTPHDLSLVVHERCVQVKAGRAVAKMRSYVSTGQRSLIHGLSWTLIFILGYNHCSNTC